MFIAFIVLLVFIVITLGYIILAFNNMVKLRNRLNNAFSQIDVQLKRRHDLIPNLVETAKAYMKHERETLEAVITARNRAADSVKLAVAAPMDVRSMAVLASAESALSGALGRFFALAEAYPDLKANQTMMQLSEELTSTENRVAFARQAYNDAVMFYNNACQVFPASLVAAPLGFMTASLLEFDIEDRGTPEVSFS
jgi:LemA protein